MAGQADCLSMRGATCGADQLSSRGYIAAGIILLVILDLFKSKAKSLKQTGSAKWVQ